MRPARVHPVLRGVALLAAMSCVTATTTRAHADEPAGPGPAQPAPAQPAPSQPAPDAPATWSTPAAPSEQSAQAGPTAQQQQAQTAPGEIQHAAHPERSTGLVPQPVEQPAPGRTTFDVDPIADGAVIAVALGFAGMLDLINSTGEIRPQQISSTFNTSNLLGIDRAAVTQTVDPNASLFSNIGLSTAAVFAVVDPVLTGFREKSVQSAFVDATLYAESVALSFAMTNMVKLAVRRPRPQAYIDFEANKGNPNYSNADTDSALSFFSGHATITAAIGATATYLAFARSPKTIRPWITLALAATFSTAVSIERVRAGAHFPTDVIAGTIAGAGVGIVVPHLHRSEDIRQRRVWVGFAPAPVGQGGTAMVTGIF